MMQDVLVEYVVEMACKAAGDKPTITAQDMMWVLRKVTTLDLSCHPLLFQLPLSISHCVKHP